MDPDAATWIDSELSVDPTKTQWAPVLHHAQMMDALLTVAGAERTYAFGRSRAHRAAQAGGFAPVVRSWSRSFGSSPTEFLRLTLHAWSAQTQNMGTFEVAESRTGYARFLMKNASAFIGRSRGWQLFLAGYGTGLLDLIQREGRCDIHLVPNSDDVEVVYTYREPSR